MAAAISKSEYVREMADRLGISASDVRTILEVQEDVVLSVLKGAKLKDRVPVIPGLVNIYKVKTKARKAHTGINPFTGEMQRYKAKPATTKVKASILSKTKSVV